MTFSLTKPSNQRLNIEIVRWGIVIFLTFFISHYLSYGKLPFDSSYEFPTRTFFIVLLYGVLICQTNTIIYRRMDRIVTFEESITKRLLYQFGLVWLSTILIFSLLQVGLNSLLLGRDITFYGFTFYLSICLFISTFETTGYTVLKLYEIFKKNPEKLSDNRISIKSNGHLIQFTFDEIAYVHSAGGIVTLVDCEKKRYITQYTAINEIAEKLPDHYFFRINRQYMISKKIIKEVKGLANRKLILQLHPDQINGISQLSISRYKRSAFKKWFMTADDQE